jgi:phenylacetate-coenzyme A ligase PaaK-like adenylate-forming protein
MIWDKEFETLPRRELETLQSERLKAVVQRVYETCTSSLLLQRKT